MEWMGSPLRSPSPLRSRLSLNIPEPLSTKRELSYRGRYSFGNTPFKWENRPGIRKETSQSPTADPETLKLPEIWEKTFQFPTAQAGTLKLPLPPSPRRSPVISGGDIGYLNSVELTPCLFRSHVRTSPKHEDPFIAAFVECTKSTKKTKETTSREDPFIAASVEYTKRAKKGKEKKTHNGVLFLRFYCRKFLRLSCKKKNACEVKPGVIMKQK